MDFEINDVFVTPEQIGDNTRYTVHANYIYYDDIEFDHYECPMEPTTYATRISPLFRTQAEAERFELNHRDHHTCQEVASLIAFYKCREYKAT